MKEQTETTLLGAARAADTDAMAELFARYTPLLSAMAKRYHEMSNESADCDDFLQEANIAFLQAVRTYDTEQTEVTFGLYAKICIRNRLVSKLRAWHQPRADEVEPPRPADPAEDLICKEHYQTLLTQIACLLSKREMDVFRLYLLGKSYRAISSSLGISEKSVDNALFRMKAKLKNAGIVW